MLQEQISKIETLKEAHNIEKLTLKNTLAKEYSVLLLEETEKMTVSKNKEFQQLKIKMEKNFQGQIVEIMVTIKQKSAKINTHNSFVTRNKLMGSARIGVTKYQVRMFSFKQENCKSRGDN